MARMTPSSYRPILGFHFKVQFEQLNDSAFVTYAKGTTLPSMTNNPVVVDHGNTYIYVKGKTRWNAITMTFYAMSTPDTNTKIWDYLQSHQKTEAGTDDFKDVYMKDVQIQLLNPDESIVKTWKLKQAFISEINFGTVDWSSEEVVQPEITFIYDYATWE